MTDDTGAKILRELEMLRKLKMMELSKAGYSQSEMGDTLGVSQKTVSRLMANPNKGKSDAKSNS